MKPRLYIYAGKTQDLKTWARELDVSYSYLAALIYKTESVAQASKAKRRVFKRVDGFAEFLSECAPQVKAISDGLFSAGERERLAAIKARRRAGSGELREQKQ